MSEATPDPIVVEEIFKQLWCKMGAQLCDFQFYSRHIPPLQDVYGCEAVAAALRQHHVEMRRAVSYQIRQQRNHAAWLRRESRKGVT